MSQFKRRFPSSSASWSVLGCGFIQRLLLTNAALSKATAGRVLVARLVDACPAVASYRDVCSRNAIRLFDSWGGTFGNVNTIAQEWYRCYEMNYSERSGIQREF